MAKKTIKSNPQSNRAMEPLSTERPFYDYMSDNSMYHFPEKDDWRRRVCYSLYEWAMKETSLVMAQFNIEYKIKSTSLKEWRRKFPEIQEAYNEAKFIIGCRRQTGAMTNKLNGFYAYRDMHKYDPEWEEVDQYHNDLKKDVTTSAMTNAAIVAENWKKIMDGDDQR